MLDRLPGLARAIEVWERDLASANDESDPDAPALYQVHCSSMLDAVDGDEPLWHGPDPLDDWMRERAAAPPDGYLNTDW